MMKLKKYAPWIALSIVVSILFVSLITLSSTTSSGYSDYIPSPIRSIASDPRMGGTSAQQMAMEKQLYADLRESSRYALPATLTSDAYDIIATEAEPTSCMLKRAENAQETSMPEGQYTPWDEIESGFLNRKEKKHLSSQPIHTLN